MMPGDPPVKGKKNEPMMPVAWTKTYKGPSGKTTRTFTTTMGASEDLRSAGLRRLIINACYWGLGMEGEGEADASVEILGEYAPLASGFNYEDLGVTPHRPSHYR